jgi:hypothetical protein
MPSEPWPTPTVQKGRPIITTKPNTDMAETRRTLFSHPPAQESHDQDNPSIGHPISYENLFREPTDTPDGRQHRAA